MARHRTLTSSNGASTPCVAKKVREIVDRQVEEIGRPARRHASFVDRERDHLHERLREQRRRLVIDDVAAVVAQRRVRNAVRLRRFEPSSATSRHFSAVAVT